MQMLRLLEYNVGNHHFVPVFVTHDRLYVRMHGTGCLYHLCVYSYNISYTLLYPSIQAPFRSHQTLFLKKKSPSTYTQCCFQYSVEYTHTTVPLFHPTSSYTLLLHHSIFISPLLILFLQYWTFHPPSVAQNPSPFSPIPPIFLGGGRLSSFSISQLKIRLSTPTSPLTHHTHMLLTSHFAIFVSHIFHPVSLFFSPYFFFLLSSSYIFADWKNSYVGIKIYIYIQCSQLACECCEG